MKTNLSSCCNAEVIKIRSVKESGKFGETRNGCIKCRKPCSLISTEETDKKWESKWYSYCNSHWSGNTNKPVNVILEVEEDFGVDFIRNLLSTKEKELREKIENDIKMQLGVWNGRGEYHDDVTKFANSILKLINKE